VLVAEDTKKRSTRRALLVGGAALLVVGATGAGFLVDRKDRQAARARAQDLASQAYGALRQGDLRRAVALANDARASDPNGREAAEAWLHASGLYLVDGDGTAADGVALLEKARLLGAKGTLIAFAALTASIATKNDKLATSLLEEQSKRGVASDAYYELAAGAVLDLACDPAAAERYAASADAWADAILPRVRRARSFLLDGKLAAAKDALASLPQGRAEVLVLGAVIKRLEAPRGKPAYVDPFAATDLPRSVRALAQALTVGAETETAGLDVALDDADTPMVAVLCGRVALSAGDLEGAAHAAASALKMRPELGEATRLAVTLALGRGDLEQAEKLAEDGSDAESKHLVRAIRAYEDRKPELVREEAMSAFDEGASAWSLASAARGLEGDGPMPTPAELEAALARGEPWAAELRVDALLAANDLEGARKLSSAWATSSAPRKRRALAIAKAIDSPDP
jgi:hypothetical protein